MFAVHAESAKTVNIYTLEIYTLYGIFCYHGYILIGYTSE